MAESQAAGSTPGQGTNDAVTAPAPAGSELVPGYRIVGHLDRGHTLDVYDVWSEERWCRCVAKVLRPGREDDAYERRRLLHEGRLVCRLSHPHIVRGYATIEEPRPAVIVEGLTGATLAHIIATRKSRPTAIEVAYLGIHLCSALSYLHRHSVLHLDLKPGNIVSERGFAKLLDFSIARAPGRGHAGEGTPQYMAPEQVRGEELGPATDVWGFGAVLFETVTGRPPFPGSADPRYEQIERPAERVPRSRRCPAALAELVDGCLSSETTRRPELERIWTVLNALVPVPVSGL